MQGEDIKSLHPVPANAVAEHLSKRVRLLADLPQIGGYDLVEMAIAANATRLLPDRLLDFNKDQFGSHAGLLHCPPLHIAELPQVLTPVEHGGILQNHGVFAVGSLVEKAVQAAVMTEDNAAIVWTALQIGQPIPIADADIAKLNYRYQNVYGQ